MAKPKLKISVVSDVVCPWCYIGKRRLEQAIAKVSDKFNFEIDYLPFELNSEMPKAGIDKKQYLSDKFGGEARYDQITAHTERTAAQEGLEFNFAAQKIAPNTRDAHRLIQLSKDDGLQLEMVEALFRAYFTDGVNLSDTEQLISIAARVGMAEPKVREFLSRNTGELEIEKIERELSKLGISGVPFYIIDSKYGISGAQSPETFIRAFEEIGSVALAEGGEACDVDSKNC